MGQLWYFKSKKMGLPSILTSDVDGVAFLISDGSFTYLNVTFNSSVVQIKRQ
jgi:hypothetical protein